MYKFYLPIGDWSGDGHCQSEDYVVLSNKPVEAVREAHFKIPEVCGIDIERVCSGYRDNVVSPQVAAHLKSLGLELDEEAVTGEMPLCPRDMADIWIFLLMKADPGLELEIEVPDPLECLCFYGHDTEGRHIGFVGYGLF